MLKRWQYGTLTAIGAASLLVLVLNVGLSLNNSSRQAEVTRRSQYIQQSAQLQNLYQEMVRTLADLSVRNKDAELRDLLAGQGITVSAAPPAAVAADAAKTPPASPAKGHP